MRHNYVAIDHLSGKPFADAIRDDQHIQHWIWTGTCPVHASSEEEERLLLREVLAQEELEITAERGRDRRRQRWQAFWGVVHRLTFPVLQVAGKRHPGAPLGRSTKKEKRASA